MICDYKKVRGFYGVKKQTYPNGDVRTYQFFRCSDRIYCKVNKISCLVLKGEKWFFENNPPEDLKPFIPEVSLLEEYKQQINKLMLL